MKAQRLSSDMISTLPQYIIETILCLVPIQDAVRTSILARNWRYTWTKIPKLVFNLKDMLKKPSERNHMQKRCDAIYQVLLQHKGPIHEFTLSMNANEIWVEIDQIISNLPRINTLKKLTLQMKYCHYIVPSYVFSMHHLTDLHLQDCHLNYQSVSNIRCSLTSLFLENEFIHMQTLLHLIFMSPLLKNFTLVISHEIFVHNYNFAFAEFFRCLPVIENLTISISLIKCFAKVAFPRELPASLVHLKYLCIKDICFVNKDELHILVLLTRCSPNLEKLKIQCPDYIKNRLNSITLDDYSDIRLEHLNELEIGNFCNLMHELDFVKIILAESPVLKKVRIFLNNKVDDEQLKMCKVLSRSTHASPLVKIIVRHV